MAGRETPLGPTGTVVSSNVKRIRQMRGMSAPDLSRALGDVGRPIPPLGVRRIEAGERRVDVDDLMALARVLRVNPTTLLLPASFGPDLMTEVTGFGTMSSVTALKWMQGSLLFVDNPDEHGLANPTILPTQRVGFRELTSGMVPSVSEQVVVVDDWTSEYWKEVPIVWEKDIDEADGADGDGGSDGEPAGTS